LSYDESTSAQFLIIKTKGFLNGAGMFPKLMGLIRGLGGEYVSLGKESHFKVPKIKAQ
jgi:hypothetical protein